MRNIIGRMVTQQATLRDKPGFSPYIVHFVRMMCHTLVSSACLHEGFVAAMLPMVDNHLTIPRQASISGSLNRRAEHHSMAMQSLRPPHPFKISSKPKKACEETCTMVTLWVLVSLSSNVCGTRRTLRWDVATGNAEKDTGLDECHRR